MSFFQIAALTAAVVNLALSLFVYWQNTKAPLHRAYLVWGLGVVLWNASAFVMMYPGVSPGVALVSAKLLQFAIILAPLGLFTTSLLIAERPIPRIVLGWVCTLHAFFAGSLLAGDWFITGVHQIQITSKSPPQLAYWSEPGALFRVYLVSYTLLLGSSIVILYRAQRETHSLQRLRIRAMLVAILCIVSAGTNDLFPILAIAFAGKSELFPVLGEVVQPLYPLVRWNFVPLGNVAACVYMTIVAYSVLQHTLLDVHVTLSRMVAHFIRIGFILLVGLCQLLIVSTFADEKLFPNSAIWCALGVLAACAVIASVFFPRLFGASGSEAFERKLLGDRFEYQDKVRSFIEHLPWYADLDLLMNDLHEIFQRSFRIESYQIILRDETKRTFGLFRAHPEDPARQLPEVKPQSAILRFFEWGKGEYLSLQRHHLRVAPGSIEREASEQLEELGAQFCFPLASQSEPFGLLLIGRKFSDEPFTATDINLLVALVKNMSLVVNQIRLKSQILQTQELDLLGRMSRGMAHDLNNLLTPVWTLLQLSGETGGFDDELLPVAQRNIKTMRAYIREALFFSENLRPDLQLGRLDLVIQQSVDLARASRKKEVEVVSVTPGEVLIEMDEVLVQRLLANLISNAIDASRSNSQINVHLDRLGRSDEGDWLRIRVVDQGEGIPKENLSRILKPYFTTKNRGDENRGFGLGLAICRKIVNLHGGNLSIASVLKKGTTVQVDLPVRQPQKAAPPVALSA
jgi:signal transduction histidine kinase